jgi:preprotein translocase subunit SecA
MIDNVNKEVISFLFKGDLPAQENQQIPRRSCSSRRLHDFKDES